MKNAFLIKLFIVLKIFIPCGAIAAILIPVIFSDSPWPTVARNYLERFAIIETGAKNLVSAIYLGYRAFDTLGETIVLLMAITGTIALISDGEVKTKQSNSPLLQPRLRTDLLEVVTGKLGPIVLIYGLYVMLFGHLSPGGGFQGGVVVASGLIFIVLGSSHATYRFRPSLQGLAVIEAISFLFLLFASSFGLFIGTGIFGRLPIGLFFPQESFIIVLNILIGLKVGAGIALMCLTMLGSEI